MMPILVVALFALNAYATAPSAEVRVRVQREATTVEVTGMGLRVAPPSKFSPLSTGGDDALSRARITRSRDGEWSVRWQGDVEPVRFRGERLTVRGQMLRVGVKPVPYDIEIVPGARRGLDVVARLDLETYLLGVLPSEMPASWPLEALKAQAVAARSFVLRSAAERRSKSFDVDSTVMDQVFTFLHATEANMAWKTKVARAVRETRGQVLTDNRDRVLKAFYSADCGCTSEDPKFVWGAVDSFQSVKDPSCTSRQPTGWALKVERGDVRARLIAALDLPTETTLRTLQVGGRTPSGRVSEVIASLDRAGQRQTVRLRAQEFRRIFGFDRVRSTDFSLRWLGDDLQITGSGLGHGVGLCQMGARELAAQGMDYRRILKTYYPQAKLRGGKGPV